MLKGRGGPFSFSGTSFSAAGSGLGTCAGAAAGGANGFEGTARAIVSWRGNGHGDLLGSVRRLRRRLVRLGYQHRAHGWQGTETLRRNRCRRYDGVRGHCPGNRLKARRSRRGGSPDRARRLGRRLVRLGYQHGAHGGQRTESLRRNRCRRYDGVRGHCPGNRLKMRRSRRGGLPDRARRLAGGSFGSGISIGLTAGREGRGVGIAPEGSVGSGARTSRPLGPADRAGC